MGLDINASQATARLNNNFFINPIQGNKVSFLQYVPQGEKPDSIDTKSDLSKFISYDAIVDMIKRNPKITGILLDAHVPVKINMDSLYALKNGHLSNTREVANGIINNLPVELREQVDVQTLRKAAILHDFGKVLIPKHILNKDGMLNNHEREIMKKHAILSYELLKTTGLDEDTLRLIKYHHQSPTLKGYPEADSDFNFDINTQILALADKYTAFRENRTYKKGLSPLEALRQVKNEVKGLGYSRYAYAALANYAQQESRLNNINSIQQQVASPKPQIGKWPQFLGLQMQPSLS